MGVFGAYPGSGAGALINPFSGTTAAETAAGVTPSSLLYEPYDLRRYGAVGDGVTDDTAAINTWINVCQRVGYGFVFPLVYATTGNHTITALLSFLSRNGAEWPINKPEFLLTANAANLFNFNGLANSGPTIVGINLRGVSFNGGGKTISDALIALQGITVGNFSQCGFHNCIGQGVRGRQLWDSTFRDCMVRTINASSAVAVINFDSRYNNDDNQNVNNITIDRCHLESNKGIWINSASDSNLNVLRLINSKLEAGVTNPVPGPLIDLKGGSNIIIRDNNFDRVNDTSGYPVQIKLGDTTAGSSAKAYDISNNQLITVTAATSYLQTQGGTTGVYKDNQQNLSNNVVGSFSNTSTYSNILEFPRNQDINSDGNQTVFLAKHSLTGYVNVAYLTSSTNFVTDSGSLDPSKSCLQSSASGQILTQFSTLAFSGRPGSLRVGVRCKSAAGTGTIQLTVNTSTLGPIAVANTAFDVVWFDVTNNYLAVMGQNGADRFRVLTGAGNSDTVTIDGVYFEFCPWHYTASFTYDPPSLGAGVGATTTVAVVGAALGDSVEVYPPYDLQGVLHSACVSSTGNVRLSLLNPTGTIDLASGSWVVRVTKR